MKFTKFFCVLIFVCVLTLSIFEPTQAIPEVNSLDLPSSNENRELLNIEQTTKVSDHEVKRFGNQLIDSGISHKPTLVTLHSKPTVVRQSAKVEEVVAETVSDTEVASNPVVKQPETAPVVKQAEPAPFVKQAEPAPVVKQPEPAPAPAPAPKPVVTQPAYKANQLIFAGTSSSYQHAGQYNPGGVQSIIDSGIVSSSVASFNPNDSQTTYFSGHNPGIMSAYYRNLQVGSIVSVTDSQGNITEYRMIEVVKTDTGGKAVFSSLGISAAQLYYMGSGQESIAIQYCVNGNTDMRVWYGVKR